MDSALSIDTDLPKHASQANPDIHLSPPVDFRFQESLIYTSIPLRQNVSARIILCELRMLIWVDTLRLFFRETAHIYLVPEAEIKRKSCFEPNDGNYE